MSPRWQLPNILLGYTAAWAVAYWIGMGVFLRALCGFAGAMAWLGIAEVIVLRMRLRKERIQREREMRRTYG
jgi:hypothetical protein